MLPACQVMIYSHLLIFYRVGVGTVSKQHAGAASWKRFEDDLHCCDRSTRWVINSLPADTPRLPSAGGSRRSLFDGGPGTRRVFHRTSLIS
jgi:hypothetical protein